MSVARRLLITLGLLAVVAVGVLTFIASRTGDFEARQSAFVEAFLIDLSESWDIDAVRGRVTDAFLREVATPAGQQTLSSFRSLGRLLRLEDFRLSGYQASLEETAGLFTFEAIFEHADASVRLAVVERDGETRVRMLDITPKGGGVDNSLRIQV